MAVRIDAEADYMIRTANMPSGQVFSFCAWVYLVSDRNAGGTFFQLVNAAFTEYVQCGLSTSGTNLEVYTQAGATTGTSLSTGTWYHVGYTRNNAAHATYLNGTADLTRDDNAALTTPTILIFGSLGGLGIWMDGRIAYIKMWNAALSAAEMAAEVYVGKPARTTNLYGWWPCLPGATERLADYSGNGYTLTANGTLTDEAGPAVAWMPVFLRRYRQRL